MTISKKNQYPHLEGIKDLHTQRTTKLLWDKAYAQDGDITSLQGQLKDALAQIKTQNSTIQTLTSQVNRISTPAITTSTTTTTSGGGGGGSGGSGGGSDDGAGAAGCGASGSNGDVATGQPLTANLAGQIVCGVGKEFPALLAPTANQPARDANVLELLGRMIWHLQRAGFTAGKQKNPSGVVSTDKLTVQVGSEMRAYDTMELNPYTNPLVVHMIQVFPASYVADAGIPD